MRVWEVKLDTLLLERPPPVESSPSLVTPGEEVSPCRSRLRGSPRPSPTERGPDHRIQALDQGMRYGSRAQAWGGREPIRSPDCRRDGGGSRQGKNGVSKPLSLI